jgi:hypothetical protein
MLFDVEVHDAPPIMNDCFHCDQLTDRNPEVLIKQIESWPRTMPGQIFPLVFVTVRLPLPVSLKQKCQTCCNGDQ